MYIIFIQFYLVWYVMFFSRNSAIKFSTPMVNTYIVPIVVQFQCTMDPTT
jgi:hypothetical protein